MDKKIEFLDEFTHIAQETVEFGYGAVLRDEDYRAFLNLNWPKGAIKDSKYGVLAQACIATALEGVISVPRWQDGLEPRLNIVLEAGHKNAGDALRFYNFVKGITGKPKCLDGLTFQTKDQSLALAIADLFAYNVFHGETGGKPIGQARGPLKSEKSWRQNIYRVPVTWDTLRSIYEQSIVPGYWASAAQSLKKKVRTLNPRCDRNFTVRVGHY